MRVARLLLILLWGLSVVVLNGCVSSMDYEDLEVKNRAQQEHLERLEGELAVANLKIGQCDQYLATAQGRADAEADSLRGEIAALEADIGKKKTLIVSLQKQLLSGMVLPVELSTQLQDFAETTEMVTYDSSSGMVKFKSDLLFERGSDEVASKAKKPLKSLCGILNSKQGRGFDLIIAGHTDDIPIKKPATRRKHPTNWHLSAHRALSVLKIMTANKVGLKRLSIRGFGEYRPVAKNKPRQGGNVKNRRVEIYIVPRGM